MLEPYSNEQTLSTRPRWGKNYSRRIQSRIYYRVYCSLSKINYLSKTTTLNHLGRDQDEHISVRVTLVKVTLNSPWLEVIGWIYTRLWHHDGKYVLLSLSYWSKNTINLVVSECSRFPPKYSVYGAIPSNWISYSTQSWRIEFPDM